MLCLSAVLVRHLDQLELVALLVMLSMKAASLASTWMWFGSC